MFKSGSGESYEVTCWLYHCCCKLESYPIGMAPSSIYETLTVNDVTIERNDNVGSRPITLNVTQRRVAKI